MTLTAEPSVNGSSTVPIAPPRVRLGFVPAHRAIFSADLAARARREIIDVLARTAGVEVVVPDLDLTPLGCVSNIKEAEATADLFRRQDVDGIVIAAVNFGDEQAAAWVVKRLGREVPVLLFGCQEERRLSLDLARRDSFCGLLSIGEALRQIGARYTVAERPVDHPTSPAFTAELDRFAGVCRVVRGLKNARYGQVGARPDAFWTCRFDEKQLQQLGATTVTLDLSEVISAAMAIADQDPDVQKLIGSIRRYGSTVSIADASVVRSAKFELVLRRWAKENGLDAVAIQCWTSIQKNYGICACTTMSRLGEEGIPCACEADILGALSMHACQLASGTPAALADWNNLHNEDDELVNVWHCGVFPRAFARAQPTIKEHEILKHVGGLHDRSEGTVEFVAKASPVTLCRVTQNEQRTKAVIVHGRFEDNTAVTFGSYGWCRIAGLQRLYRDVLMAHFPHHVALTHGQVGSVLWEALGKYLGLAVYHVDQPVPGAYVSRSPFAG